MEISFQCVAALTKNFILCNTKCVPAKSGSRFALGKTMSAARAPRSAFFVSAFYGGLCSEGLARSARATLGMAHHQSYFALDGGGSSTSYEYTAMDREAPIKTASLAACKAVCKGGSQ